MTDDGDLAEVQTLRPNHNRPLDTKPLGDQTRAVRRQTLMVVLGNIGVVATGIGMGLPTVTLDQLQDPAEPVHLTQEQASWYASINTLSCPVGGLLSAYLLDKFGRKIALYNVNVVALLAWALMALTPQSDPEIAFVQLLVSRFLIGIATGLSTAPMGVYAAEISLPKMRGHLILGTALSTAFGVLLIYVVGYFIRNDWRLIALLCCGFQILSLLCLLPMPESPSWLVSKRRLNEAKMSLNYFRGLEKTATISHPEVLAEFVLLQKSVQLGVGERNPSFLRSLRLPEVYKPLLILMGLFAFQQLSGSFVIIVYAVQISADAGVSIDPFVCAVLVGVARVAVTCPLGAILERWGRRRAGMISGVGMSATMFLLAAHGWSAWLHEVPFLPVVAIVAYIVLSTVGLFTLPFFMLSELFPQKVRGPASGLTVAVGMFIAFLSTKTYPAMRTAIGPGSCFVVFGAISALAIVFVYFFLPETRRRSLLEIEEQFRNKKPPPDVEVQAIK